MRLVNISSADKRQLDKAADLLRQTFPAHLAWIHTIVDVLDGRSPSCGCDEKTLACTLPKNDRVYVGFHRRISSIPVVELAIALSHEGRHWTRHPYLPGRLLQVKHTCSDAGCLQEWERLIDPVYAVDAQMRPILERHWAMYGDTIAAQYPEPSEVPWKELAVAAAIIIGLGGMGGLFGGK